MISIFVHAKSYGVNEPPAKSSDEKQYNNRANEYSSRPIAELILYQVQFPANQ